MKKTLLIAAVAIGMAACTNETDIISPQDSQEIAVKAVAYNPTRSAVSGMNFPTTTAMYVSAWQKDGATYISYLDDAQFLWNGSSAWTGGYFYPTSGVLHVQAYSCDEGADQKKPTAKLNGNTSTEQISSLVLDFSDAPLEGKTDVMWSEIAFPTKNASGSYGSFSLPFHHALSWIVVNFINPTPSSTAHDAILIKNVKLNNVQLSGKLTVTPTYSGSNVDSYTPVWSDKSAATDVEFPAYVVTPSATGIPFGDAASLDAQGLLIIPCAQTTISFDYCTKNGGTLANPTYTDWITYTVSGLTGNWDAEKKYIYNISISTTEISITASVTGWGDGGTTDKTLD